MPRCGRRGLGDLGHPDPQRLRTVRHLHGPASGGTATTFKEGIANTYSFSCYGTGFSSAIPGTTRPRSPSTPAPCRPTPRGHPPSSSPACTTSTSGSGLTEEYILSAPSPRPPRHRRGSYGELHRHPGCQRRQHGHVGHLTVNVARINPTCLDPASGGTATTFYAGAAGSYTVECEARAASPERPPIRPRSPSQRAPCRRWQPDLRHLDLEQSGRHHRHLGVGDDRGVHPRVRPGRHAELR